MQPSKNPYRDIFKKPTNSHTLEPLHLLRPIVT